MQKFERTLVPTDAPYIINATGEVAGFRRKTYRTQEGHEIAVSTRGLLGINVAKIDILSSTNDPYTQRTRRIRAIHLPVIGDRVSETSGDMIRVFGMTIFQRDIDGEEGSQIPGSEEPMLEMTSPVYDGHNDIEDLQLLASLRVSNPGGFAQILVGRDGRTAAEREQDKTFALWYQARTTNLLELAKEQEMTEIDGYETYSNQYIHAVTLPLIRANYHIPEYQNAMPNVLTGAERIVIAEAQTGSEVRVYFPAFGNRQPEVFKLNKDILIRGDSHASFQERELLMRILNDLNKTFLINPNFEIVSNFPRD